MNWADQATPTLARIAMRSVVDIYGLGQGRTDPLCDLEDDRRCDDAGADDEKLVAPEAADLVVLANC